MSVSVLCEGRKHSEGNNSHHETENSRKAVVHLCRKCCGLRPIVDRDCISMILQSKHVRTAGQINYTMGLHRTGRNHRAHYRSGSTDPHHSSAYQLRRQQSLSLAHQSASALQGRVKHESGHDGLHVSRSLKCPAVASAMPALRERR